MPKNHKPSAVQEPPELDRLPKELLQFDQLPDAAHVRMPTVCCLTGGVTPACVWKWVKAGDFPEPVKLGPQVTAWNVGELRRYLAAKKTSKKAA